MKYSELASLTVYTDGGASNNGNANGSGLVNCYGSYLVVALTYDGKFVPVKHEDRLPMPHLETNNEAEYQSFVNGARYLINLFDRTGIRVPVTFKIDSNLVFTQMSGKARCKALNLQHFYSEGKELVGVLNATLERISGDEMKVVLGH
ncbi:MAG: hypothetical protein ABSE06_01400 [Anaerolineaceae bacterium]|jgi:ribonuclease HI